MSGLKTVTEQQYTDGVAWTYEFMAAGDRLDPRPWIAKYFTADAEFFQPNQAPAKGHEAILATMEAQQGILKSIKHHIHRVDILADRVYCEAGIEWVVNGDPEARIIKGRGLGVFTKRADEDRLSGFDVYADFGDLLRRFQEVNGIAGSESTS